MSNGDVQDNLADDYLSQYNLNLGVSAVKKISQFSYIQNLTYNGILSYLKDNFLSLSDWQEQITTYSSSNLILTNAYALIKSFVSLNRKLSLNLVEIDGLGEVGNEFSSLQGYNKVFSLSDSELTDPNTANSKVESIS